VNVWRQPEMGCDGRWSVRPSVYSKCHMHSKKNFRSQVLQTYCRNSTVVKSNPVRIPQFSAPCIQYMSSKLKLGYVCVVDTAFFASDHLVNVSIGQYLYFLYFYSCSLSTNCHRFPVILSIKLESWSSFRTILLVKSASIWLFYMPFAFKQNFIAKFLKHPHAHLYHVGLSGIWMQVRLLCCNFVALSTVPQ